ncbi:hypothetical protein A0U95_00995 [Pseudomonas brassicacearum]|nr:hypothetical protein [Pseudomonas brassicacearum]AOS37380.1 hypothetical protein A0U95_00995 [Pseudomonas brassicacearum]
MNRMYVASSRIYQRTTQSIIIYLRIESVDLVTGKYIPQLEFTPQTVSSDGKILLVRRPHIFDIDTKLNAILRIIISCIPAQRRAIAGTPRLVFPLPIIIIVSIGITEELGAEQLHALVLGLPLA